MSAKFIQEGRRIDYTPSADVDAGDVVVLGDALVGIATYDIPDGKAGSLAIEGVFEFPKVFADAGEAIALGKAVLWNTSTSKATLVAHETNTVGLGVCVKAAHATNDKTVLVKLVGPLPAYPET